VPCSDRCFDEDEAVVVELRAELRIEVRGDWEMDAVSLLGVVSGSCRGSGSLSGVLLLLRPL
jgi:hypothetical protein